jgi:hypothetical protein
VENIITQDHCHGIASNKFLTDDKSLGQSVRAWLYRIAQLNAELVAVAQKSFKPWRVVRSGDNQDIPDSRIHKDRQRIVYHWFVVNRKQLFGSHLGKRIEPRPASSGQYNPFHISSLVRCKREKTA